MVLPNQPRTTKRLGRPLTPHGHLRLRLRRIAGRRPSVRIPHIWGHLRTGDVAAVRSQHRIDPPARDRPLLPFQLGRHLGRHLGRQGPNRHGPAHRLGGQVQSSCLRPPPQGAVGVGWPVPSNWRGTQEFRSSFGVKVAFVLDLHSGFVPPGPKAAPHWVSDQAAHGGFSGHGHVQMTDAQASPTEPLYSQAYAEILPFARWTLADSSHLRHAVC